jgi:predicted dehydrogenase
MKFALLGAGFWSRFQLAGWREIGGTECVAIYNRTLSKAQSLASDFGVPAAYDDVQELLDHEKLDFIDIVTSADTHPALVRMAADRRIPVICQKPMAESLAVAESIVTTCSAAGVPFYVNENWRWQTPIRALKRVIDDGRIGDVFRARIRMVSGFDLFTNQPFLKELDQFLLVDIGSHILDVARFLFGEVDTLCCHIQRVRPDIKGEDVATVMLRMRSGATVICEMGYPGAPLEHDRFPQTFAFVEGNRGSVELAPDYELRVTTSAGTEVERHVPRHYSWADPAYDVVHSSIVPCQANLLGALRGAGEAETTGADNLRTMRLVYRSYESARESTVIRLP